MPKINQEEYEVLKGLDDKWKWIARDRGNILWAYSSKPYKGWGRWGGIHISDVEFVSIDKFELIQREDPEPYNISELIEEYEHSAEHVSHVVNERVKALGKAWSESEETEVKKDKEWLIKRVENYVPLNDKTVGHVVDNILDIIRQLDEPEVLSQKWVDENSTNFPMSSPMTRWVPASKLQNLLVPKQEEEQKYYVLGKDDRTMLVRKMDGKTITTGDLIPVGELRGTEKEAHALTEQEIKGYDERYWAFKEKVEVTEYRLMF